MRENRCQTLVIDTIVLSSIWCLAGEDLRLTAWRREGAKYELAGEFPLYLIVYTLLETA